MELSLELKKQYDRLEKEKNALYRLGREKAEAERKYRVALQQEELKLKEKGYAATLISDLARGNEEVANLKFERDVAETMYKSAIASLTATISQGSILKDLYDKLEEI